MAFDPRLIKDMTKYEHLMDGAGSARLTAVVDSFRAKASPSKTTPKLLKYV